MSGHEKRYRSEEIAPAVTRRMEGEPPSGSRFTKNVKTSYQSVAPNTPFANLVLQVIEMP